MKIVCLFILITLTTLAVALALVRSRVREFQWIHTVRTRTAILVALSSNDKDLTTQELIELLSRGEANAKCIQYLWQALDFLEGEHYVTRREGKVYHLTAKGNNQLESFENQVHFVPAETVTDFSLHFS